VTECGSRLITRAEIIAFAAEYDPQPMHLDEAAARASLFGGLVASGWHSCCVLMRMLTDGMLAETSFMGAPGVEEVQWLAPIRPGARVKARDRARDARFSQPARRGIREIPARTRRCVGPADHELDGESDVRTA